MIICAAVKFFDTVLMVRRHYEAFDLMGKLNERLLNDARKENMVVQGFVDNSGNFLNREDAFMHALNCGQISASLLQYKDERNETELYSEDLY